MKSSSNRNCYNRGHISLLLAATIIVVSSLLFLPESVISIAEFSHLSSSALDHVSHPVTISSEGVSPPLITSGGPEPQQGTTPGPQQQLQRYSMYENPRHNFSTEYPSDWQVEERRAGVVATFSSRFETNFDPFAANFAIGVENLTAGNTLDNYTRSVVALLQSQPPGPDFNITGGPMPTTLGGFPAQRIGFTVTAPNERGLGSESRLEGVQIWTIDNDTAYVLSFAAEQNKFSSYLPVIEHVIDTFRITRAAG